MLCVHVCQQSNKLDVSLSEGKMKEKMDKVEVVWVCLSEYVWVCIIIAKRWLYVPINFFSREQSYTTDILTTSSHVNSDNRCLAGQNVQHSRCRKCGCN